MSMYSALTTRVICLRHTESKTGFIAFLLALIHYYYCFFYRKDFYCTKFKMVDMAKNETFSRIFMLFQYLANVLRLFFLI